MLTEPQLRKILAKPDAHRHLEMSFLNFCELAGRFPHLQSELFEIVVKHFDALLVDKHPNATHHITALARAFPEQQARLFELVVGRFDQLVVCSEYPAEIMNHITQLAKVFPNQQARLFELVVGCFDQLVVKPGFDTVISCCISQLAEAFPEQRLILLDAVARNKQVSGIHDMFFLDYQNMFSEYFPRYAPLLLANKRLGLQDFLNIVRADRRAIIRVRYLTWMLMQIQRGYAELGAQSLPIYVIMNIAEQWIGPNIFLTRELYKVVQHSYLRASIMTRDVSMFWPSAAIACAESDENGESDEKVVQPTQSEP